MIRTNVGALPPDVDTANITELKAAIPRSKWREFPSPIPVFGSRCPHTDTVAPHCSIIVRKTNMFQLVCRRVNSVSRERVSV